MARRGRPQKPYETSWGEIVAGLTQCGDGRWRISATDFRFTEHDERRAINKAKLIIERLQKKEVVDVEAEIVLSPLEVAAANGNHVTAGLRKLAHLDNGDGLFNSFDLGEHNRIVACQMVDPAILWPWLRQQLIERPAWVAEQVGIPELTSLARFEIPKSPLRIQTVIAAFREHCSATEKSKKETLKPFHKLVDFAAAKTLDDLTDEKLLAFRAKLVRDPRFSSSATVSAYFSRIRNVIRTAGRALDAVQINAAVARCQGKLYSPENNVEDDPHPISRENFHKLLDGVEATNIAPVWRAMLLLGLNCALYMEDICGLQWKHFNLEQGIYLARRKKRGRCLRAAALWPQTLAALLAIPRRGESEYVFVSTHGTRYNKNTKINDFKDFREKIGVVDVTFSHLRDGAYTAACQALGVDVKFAELLAGHATGMKDKYVLRSPGIVKPATDAVYKAYFE